MTAYIFLIDDDEKSNDIYQERLRNRGYEVAYATSGSDGIQAIQQRPPDLVILDVQMHDMTGLEVCKQIRANQQTKEIPILVLSASERWEIESFRVEADDYVTKHADRDVFLERVRRLLTRKQHRGSSGPCVLSITVSDRIHFELTGAVTDRGEGSLSLLDSTHFNRDMAFMSSIIYDYYNHWLDARRRGQDLDEVNYLKKRQLWRPQVADKGRELHQLIFQQNWRLIQALSKAQQSVGDAEEQLTLRFSGLRSNLALPFEALHIDSQPLAIRHPISRQVNNIGIHRTSWENFLVSLPGRTLRVLLLAGDEVALPELFDVTDRLHAALKRVDIHVEVEPPDLKQPITLDEAESRLSQKSYHLIHYAGHAFFDSQRPENSYLSLMDNNRNLAPIRTTRLAGLLRNSLVQFLFLSCCSGAEIADDQALQDNAYLGLIDAAVQAGVPAVLGFRWPIAGRSARKFAINFYDGLAHYPYSLEHAAWSARRQIFETSIEGGWDETWFSPMLVVQNPY